MEPRQAPRTSARHSDQARWEQVADHRQACARSFSWERACSERRKAKAKGSRPDCEGSEAGSS